MTGSASTSFSASLGFDDLLLSSMTLAPGAVHWLHARQSYDALQLMRQTLASMRQDRAVFVGTEHAQRELLAGLAADQGPRELALLNVAPSRLKALLQVLTSELDRAARVERRIVLLALPVQTAPTRNLHRWIEAVAAWLKQHSAALLVFSEGDEMDLSAGLHRAPGLAGFAELYRKHGTPWLRIYDWHSRPAWEGPREVQLEEHGKTFRTHHLESHAGAIQVIAPDRDEVHAERAALAGIRNQPVGWQVHADRAELLRHVASAQYATVLFGVSRGNEVDELAVRLDELRRACGNHLKIVIREVSPCLRYRDDQLLIAAGASLIMPFGTPLARSLTLIDSIQGHTWQRRNADIGSSLSRSKPLPLRGLLTPRTFAEAVRQMWSARHHGELEHALLRIQLLPGLGIASLLGESSFRRQGDVICLTPDGLYLFLFACRSETVEAALDNIFPLSWQELFASFELLDSLEALDSPHFQDDRELDLSAPETFLQAGRTRALSPRPVRLQLTAGALR